MQGDAHPRTRAEHPRKKQLLPSDGGYAPPTDWGEYMVNKKAKLQEQFHEDRQLEGGYEQVSNIFAGVKLHVNGLTKPTGPELKKLMSMHGGLYEQYPDSTVTHIIASNLPQSKFRLLTGKEKILVPEWITESIRAGKLLPEREFSLIDRMKNTLSNTVTLTAFVEPKTTASTSSNVPLSRPSTTTTSTELVEEKELRKTVKEKEDAAEEFVNGEEGDDWGWWLAQKQQISNPDRSDGVEDAVKKGQVQTAKDADFLQNYYKSSRLHHLSAWKAEFQRSLMQQLADMYHEKEKTKTREQQKNNKKKPAAELLTADAEEEDGGGSNASVIQNSGEVHQPDDPPRRIVAHIDMDCFFAAVAIRTNPSLAGQPIIISHSSEDSASGSASISSCNYEARAFGIKNGMSVGQARKLCDKVRIVGYQFDDYEKVSRAVYEVLVKNFETIQAVSCDEAYVELQDCTFSTAEEILTRVRKEILAHTNCNASAGIGPNMLLARMATKKAKPNGQFCIRPSGLVRFLAEQKVKDLPSVGPAIAYSLKQKNITKLADLLTVSKEELQKEFGEKTGERLWFFSRGIDDRELQVFHKRKSVGVDLNWGVRLNTLEEAKKVLGDLAVELSSRMQRAGVRGAHLTCKVKKRKPGAPTPAKWLGHGLVDNFSKSVALTTAIADAAAILDHAIVLFRSLEIDAKEVRGLGLHMTKLSPLAAPVPTAIEKQPEARTNNEEHSVLAKALPSAPPKAVVVKKHKRVQQVTLSQHVVHGEKSAKGPITVMEVGDEDSLHVVPTNVKAPAVAVFIPLPRADELEATVLAELPAGIQQEINEVYGGAQDTKPPTKTTKKKKDVTKKSSKSKEKEKDTRDKVPITALLDQPAPKPKPLLPHRVSTPPEEKVLTFAAETSSIELRSALREWIRSISDPEEIHLELLAQFLFFHIEKRNLELTQRFLEWLRELLEEGDVSSWKRAFDLLLGKIQSVLWEKYSARFSIRPLIEETE